MSYRNGFVLTIALVAFGAASAHAQDDRASAPDRDDRKDGGQGDGYAEQYSPSGADPNDRYDPDGDGHQDRAPDPYSQTTDSYSQTTAKIACWTNCVYADDDFWYGDRQRVTHTRFRGMDRNDDGVIDRSEWRGNDRSFRKQDWDGDGVLSGREVRRKAVRIRNRFTAVDAIDRDRDGAIARREWMGSRREFDRLDRNRDGYITSAEARLRYY